MRKEQKEVFARETEGTFLFLFFLLSMQKPPSWEQPRVSLLPLVGLQEHGVKNPAVEVEANPEVDERAARFVQGPREDRLQLQKISQEDDADVAKDPIWGGQHLVEATVDAVQDEGAHHADLVNHDKLDIFEHFPSGGEHHTAEILEVAPSIFLDLEAKGRVDGGPSHVESCDAGGGCQDDSLLWRWLRRTPQAGSSSDGQHNDGPGPGQ